MNGFERKVFTWVHRLTLLAIAVVVIVVAWAEAVHLAIKFAMP